MSHPFIPMPNTCSVEMIYSCAGQIYENQIHVGKGSPYSLADIQALRAIIDTWDNTNWKTQRSGASSLVRIRTKALDSLGAPYEDFALATPRAGLDGTTLHALNVAFCIKLSTGLTGRSYRGRLYIGAISNDLLQTPVTMSVTAANNFIGQLTTLKNNLSAAGHTWYVVSYRQNKTWLTTGVRTAVTTFIAVDYNLDSMRSRLPGHSH